MVHFTHIYLSCSYENSFCHFLFVHYQREQSFATLSFSSLVQLSSQPQVKGYRVEVMGVWSISKLM